MISDRVIRNMEVGKTPIRIRELLVLARVYNISKEWLLNGEDRMG